MRNALVYGISVMALSASLHGAAAPAQAATTPVAATAEQAASNPFFQDWTTPFAAPPFHIIRPEHFPPALERGMAEQLAEVRAIATNPEAPSFANTIEAMERTGALLTRAHLVFDNLTSSQTSDALQAIELDMAPKLAQHHSRIHLDGELFARIDDLYRRRAALGLDEARTRLLERYHLNFVRAGAQLDAAGKQRLAAITEELATLTTTFGQNVLADEKSWQLVLDGEAELAGLPDFVRSAAAQAAKDRNMPGKHVITLSRSSIEPFLTFSARRDLREKAFKAWIARGDNGNATDNKALIARIVALRGERAKLLGFESFAAFKLADTMAKTPEAAQDLMLKVWGPAKARLAEERAMLQAQAAAEGMNEPIQAWDWRHYAEKVRKAKFDLDEAEVKPYFQLENIVQAAFDTATRLFGVTFTPRPDVPVYNPDVRMYEVKDRDGRHVGLFLQDNFARAEKRSGAWMSSYRDYRNLDGEVTPIISNNNNFAKGEPTLLSYDDAETLFHEFGHGLQGLLTKAKYPSQAGTNVMQDFVEFPSQVYEHWLSQPETLRKYARHYKTGEPLPQALLDRILAARTFNQGFATVEYLSSGLVDMALHDLPPGTEVDAASFEAEALAKIGMPDGMVMRHRLPHFLHLFQGDSYAAGYYSYMWAEVLDADGFAAFQEAGDVFDPALAAKLHAIYSGGDTRDPMALYTEFRGRAPEIGALLRMRGLVPAGG